MPTARIPVLWPALALVLGLACTDKPATDSSGRDTGAAPDSGDPGDSGDPVDSGGTDDSGAVDWPSGMLVLDHVAVVDALTVREAAAVLIAGDQVWDVVDAGQAWPDDATVVDHSDVPDATVVPGLIDAHTHLFLSGSTWWVGDTLAANLRAQLAWGVTGVIDLGSPVESFELRDRIATGEIVGPRIFAAGPMITTELSHPCETLDDDALCRYVDGDAADVLAELDAADGLKVVLADADFTDHPTPRLDLGDLAEITALAGRPVFAHIDEPDDATDALDAGVDVLAHPVFSTALDSSTLDAIAASTTISTFGAFAGTPDLVDGALLADDLSHTPDAVVAAWTWLAANPGAFSDGWVDDSRDWDAAATANLATMVAAGVPIAAGSDAGYWFVPHGVGLHRELDGLVEAGMTPQQALAAATQVPAGLAGWTDLGLVAAGYTADLLVVSGRPDLDIAALRSVETVYMGGQAWTGGALVQTAAEADEGGFCLNDGDCADADAACDLLDHVCRPACDRPYHRTDECDDSSWCMPADAVDTTTDGVCHPDDGCDLYAQDCTPEAYAEACIPMDLDSNRCWPSGERTAGQTCSFSDPTLYCAQGAFCSWVDERCYDLCDPDDHTPRAGCTTCTQQWVDGQPWFGICS